MISVPHNPEVEQQLIGAILSNNEAYGVVSSLVEVQHFHEPAHQLIFGVARDMIVSGKKVTPVTIKDALPPGEIAGIPFPVYVARCAAEATTVINAPDFARHIRALAGMRDVVDIAKDMVEARNSGALPEDALRLALDHVARVQSTNLVGSEDVGSADKFADFVLQGIYDAENGEKQPIPATGLKDLDRAIGGGYRPRRLIVAAGRPGMGKTVFAVSSARRAARSKFGVAFFSLEIDGHEVMCRMLADETSRTTTPVPYADVLAGNLSSSQVQSLERARERLHGLPIEIDARGGLSMFEIAGRCRLICERWRKAGVAPGVVFIDYLGLIRPSERYRGNKVNELGEIALAGKHLAKELGVCVVLLSQLNREVEKRDDKRPTMADLRDSGNIEEHADAVILLYRPAYYDQRNPNQKPEEFDAVDQRKNDLELILGKNRLGPTNKIKAFCSVANSSIDNISKY